MTVSRVLRNAPHVTEATREKVMDAVERTGYRSNPMVQALMAAVRRKNVRVEANLAWISYPRTGDSRTEQLLEGARERARELGFGFETLLLETGAVPTERMDSILRARGVRGVILAPLPQTGVFPDFPWKNYSLATIGHSIQAPLISHTMLDSQAGMETTLHRITERGYRRIAFLSSPGTEQRFRNLPLMVFRRYSLQQPPEARIEPIDTELEGWSDRDLIGWLERARPDAILATLPKHARRVQALNLRALDQVGYATLSWRENFPDITGLHHPMRALGAAATEIVVAQIHRNERGIPARAKTMLIAGDWMEGATLPQKAAALA